MLQYTQARTSRYIQTYICTIHIIHLCRRAYARMHTYICITIYYISIYTQYYKIFSNIYGL